jgi:cell division transport system permease protein
MRRWSYIMQEAVIGLRRNLSMTVAVILSVAVSLMLFGASVLLRQQVDMATDEWTDKIEVSIFLCDGRECASITPEQQRELREDLEANALVERVFFESKEEAYQRFLERFEGQEDFTRGVTADQLPASFRVKLVDPSRFAAIRQEYEARPGVEDIIDQRELLEQFLKIADVGRWSALGISIVAMLAATLLVANTVRVAAFARREQTQVMKLVGASNWYIRLPFVLEGILAGLFGALVAWVLLVAGVPFLTDFLRDLIAFVPFLDRGDVLAVFPWLVVPSIVIAGTSSLVALWGFLDV